MLSENASSSVRSSERLSLKVTPVNFGKSTILRMLFGVYIFYLFLFTLVPFTFSVDSSNVVPSLYGERFEGLGGFCCVTLWDIISNIVLFVPFGFFFITRMGGAGFNPVKQIMSAGICACVLSFTIESLQLTLPRSPSLVDVSLNTLGAVFGALIGLRDPGYVSQIVEKCGRALGRSESVRTALAVYCLALFITYCLPLPLRPNFSNWDWSFPFQIGNEASLDRPWLGKVYLVAMYHRALGPEEVKANFSAGPHADSANRRVRESLEKLYDFTEGQGDIVHDQVGIGESLDLRIKHPDRIRWLRPNGVEFLDSTSIFRADSGSARDTKDLYVKGELTLEAWISPADMTENPPARIVSYSRDPNQRNLTLGQDGRDVVFRLRTPVSGLNGTKPELRTGDQPLAKGVQHLVSTYRDGVVTLYVNSNFHQSLSLDQQWSIFDKLDELYGLKWRWPYWSFLIFPVGLLSYLLFAGQVRHAGSALVVSALFSIGALAAIEGLQLLTLSRPFDPLSVSIIGGTVLLSLITGVMFKNIVEPA